LAGHDFSAVPEKKPALGGRLGGRCSIFRLARPPDQRNRRGLARFHRTRNLTIWKANWPTDLPEGRHPRRSVSRQRLLPRRPPVGPDRLPVRLQRQSWALRTSPICLQRLGALRPDHAFNVTKGAAPLLNGYGRERAFVGSRAGPRLPLLAPRRGAAIPCSPGSSISSTCPTAPWYKAEGTRWEYVRKLRFPARASRRCAITGVTAARMRGVSDKPHVIVFTDGACLGQSRARRLGRDPEIRRRRKGN